MAAAKYLDGITSRGFYGYPDHLLRPLVNPADPSLAMRLASFEHEPAVDRSNDPATSYSANAFAFVNRPTLTASFPDGLSGTIWFAERYAQCRGMASDYTNFLYGRTTFADGGPVLGGDNNGHVYPITEGFPPVTRPSRPGATFQVRPSVGDPDAETPQPNDCDRTLPQTPHPGGMLIGLGGGSARGVAPGVRPETFWALVTPAGGEVLGSDW